MRFVIKKNDRKYSSIRILRFSKQFFLALLILLVMLLGGCTQSAPEETTILPSSISVNIKDLTPPIISSTKDTYTVTVGADLDLQSAITVTDNIDKNMAFEVVGNLDTEKPGQYVLLIKAVDTSNNVSNKNITVHVIDKLDQVVPSPSVTEKPKQHEISNNVPEPTTPVIERDYLYTDGFDMNTAVSACQSDLATSKRSGTCMPIKDAAGIYKGMHLSIQ